MSPFFKHYKNQDNNTLFVVNFILVRECFFLTISDCEEFQ